MTADPTAPRGALPGLATLLPGQVRYQVLLLVRTPRALVAGIALPLILLVLRGGRGGTARAGTELTAGLSVLGVITIAYLTHAAGLVTAREDGVLRRWRATPLPAWCFFAGRIAATALLAGASTCATLLAAVSFEHLHVGAGAVTGLLVTVLTGSLCWAALGTAATALVPTAESAQPLLALTFYPVVLLSGMFGDIGDEPRWLTTIVGYLPARPLVEAATRALGNGPGATLLSGHDLLVLGLWTLAGLVASVTTFRWHPRRTTGRTARTARAGAPDHHEGTSR